MRNLVSRRTILRGAGVALALPWMESLVPKAARAAAPVFPKRFMPIFFPNGAPVAYWPPTGQGAGAAWSLSPCQQPFEALKSKIIVVSNLQSFSCARADQSVEPSHGRLGGMWLTSVDSDKVRDELDVPEGNGISIDEEIAQKTSDKTAIQSLQVGISTVTSFCDGRPCSLSQSVSWVSPTQPLYKEVNPQAVFDRLVGAGAATGGGGGPVGPDPEAERRRLLKKSVLDAVIDNAESTNARLSVSDRMKLDQFLTSVRALEERVTMVGNTMTPSAECVVMQRPGMPAQYGLTNGANGYDKAAHADVMNDLIVMALQCDTTRIISYMLDDERSEFVYNHLTQREFTAQGSTPGSGTCSEYHGLQHAGDSNNGFATITWWMSSKVAELCQKLDAIPEGDGTLLDHSVVVFGSGMQGSNHDANKLPTMIIGGGNGTFKTDQHVVLPEAPSERAIRDLWFTIANNYFGLGLTTFGVDVTGRSIAPIGEILNT